MWNCSCCLNAVNDVVNGFFLNGTSNIRSKIFCSPRFSCQAILQRSSLRVSGRQHAIIAVEWGSTALWVGDCPLCRLSFCWQSSFGPFCSVCKPYLGCNDWTLCKKIVKQKYVNIKVILVAEKWPPWWRVPEDRCAFSACSAWPAAAGDRQVHLHQWFDDHIRFWLAGF